MRVQGKTFPTFRTYKGSFSCVTSLMCNKIRVLGKTFPTFRTYKGSFSCVTSLMCNKSRALGKTFPTFRTCKGSFSCVTSLMCNKIRVTCETFPTFRTYKWFFFYGQALVNVPCIHVSFVTRCNRSRCIFCSCMFSDGINVGVWEISFFLCS
ncbi:hypothetical protein FKM82_019193 [Ascaphus truei]